MSTCALFIVAVLALPQTVSSFCTASPAGFLDGPMGARLPYCEYNGIKLAPGTHFEDLRKCRDVSCSENGFLSICGTGLDAGVVAPTPGCIRVNDICTAKTIQDPTSSTACPYLS